MDNRLRETAQGQEKRARSNVLFPVSCTNFPSHFTLLTPLNNSLIPYPFSLFLLFSLIVMSCIATGAIAQEGESSIPSFLQEKQFEESLKFVDKGVKNVTETSALIYWKTNIPSKARIQIRNKLGKRRNYNQLNKKRNHEFFLSDLREGTMYGFRVRAKSGDSVIASGVTYFRTKGMPPPRFIRKNVVKRTLDGGVVKWKTNIPTRAVLRADYDTRYRFRTVHETPVRHHSVSLTRFGPNKQVQYQITARDTRGRTAQAGGRFKTRENNVAWNKPVEGTFTHPLPGLPDGHPAGDGSILQRIVDDSYDYTRGMATSGNPADTDQWISVDLGELYRPDTVVLYWRFSAYPKKYALYGSSFGRNWEKLTDELNAGEGKEVTTPGGGSTAVKQVITEFPGLEHPIRLIKLKVPKGAPYYAKYPQYKYVQLIEMKVFPVTPEQLQQ